MAGTIFISYRRAQSLSEAQHLATILGKAFGKRRVFIDVRGIDGFSDWFGALKKQVEGSAAMIAVIGNDWLNARDKDGNRALDNPQDFVRFEIEEALRRRIPVMCVLLDGVSLPAHGEVPVYMRGMLDRQAMELRARRFPEDAEAICHELKRVLGERRTGWAPWKVAAAASLALVAGIAAGRYALAPGVPDISVPLKMADEARRDAERRAGEADARSSEAIAGRKEAESKLADVQREALAEAAEIKRLRDLLAGGTPRDIQAAARIAALSKQLDEQKAAGERTQTQVEQLSAQLGAKDKEIATLGDAAAAEGKKRQTAEIRAKTAEAQLEIASAQKNEVAAQVTAISKQLDERKAASEKAEAENQRLTAQLAAKVREIARLQEADDAACSSGVLIPIGAANTKSCIKPGSGKSFRDCPDCPDMVVAPAGSFAMGSSKTEDEHRPDEEPQTKVTFSKPFAVGQYSITRGQFERFAKATGLKAENDCYTYVGAEITPAKASWRSPGFEQADDHPAVCVSWNDATAYTDWLSKITGQKYRLLTEAEFEYAARANQTTRFWWGNWISTAQANYDGRDTDRNGDQSQFPKKTTPVRSYQSNPWGLYQVHGNAWTWVQDCYVGDYTNLAADGAAVETSGCAIRVLRGGSWNSKWKSLRAAYRGKGNAAIRITGVGFRLARTL